MLTKRNLIKSEENLEILCRKLNYLFDFLDKVYDINAGGCCYVASILTKLLEQDNIKYAILIYDCEYDDFYDIDCSQYHYAIRIKSHIINGFNNENYSEFYNVSSYDLKQHYKECSWNDMYETTRNKYIKNLIIKFYNNFTYDLRE